jgi:hypothetical protein
LGENSIALIGFLITTSLLLLSFRAFAQTPDGPVKLNSRSVSLGIGLSWGEGGGGSFVKIKNPHGVIIDLVSTIEGRKFVLGRDSIDIKIAEKKP